MAPSKQSTEFESIVLDTPIGAVSALRSGAATSATKVLAVHGWLDNRASFIPLLPYLPDCDFVAIDLPGHGYSAHRPGHHFGYLADFVLYLPMILDALQWDQCHIVGHSMGAGIACVYTACAGPRVQSLSLIDLLGPLSTTAAQGPVKMAQALTDYGTWDPTRKRLFDDLESSVQARMRASAFDLDYDNSKLIMQYATQPTNAEPSTAAGLTLMSDPRLKFTSPVSFTENQVLAYINAISQPALLVYASDGILDKLSSTPTRIAAYQNLRQLRVQGGHYVHMEQPEQVATAIKQLIKQAQ